MSRKNFSRKDFITLTLTAVGTTVLGCSSSDEGSGDGSDAGSAGSDDNGVAGNGGTSAGGNHSGGNGGQSSGGGGSSNQGGSGGNNNGGNAGTGGTSGNGGNNNGGNGGTGGNGGNNNGGSGGEVSANECTDSITAAISMNHGHELTIPLEDLTAGVTKLYDVQGTASHPHYVQLTAADFTLLKNGGTVTKHSCSGGDHEFVLSCTVATVEPGAPNCDGTDCGGTMENFCADPA